AFAVLVIASPDILFQWGFQLSFGATVGILLWSAPAAERIAKLFPDPSSRAAVLVSNGFGTTIAAQLSVAPLLAWHFGRVPGVGAQGNVSCRQGEIGALDVGQGTAVLVRAGGHAVLLDGGPPGAGIMRQLGALGVRRIDLAVASHPHRDHVEGFVDVLGHIPV